MDPKVPDALALRDPLEVDLLAPNLGAFSPARPDGGEFVPIYLGTECLVDALPSSL